MKIYKILYLNNLPNEIWRDVIGYEGLYEVSSLGRVKSLIDNHGKPREKIRQQIKNNKGYLFVNLYKEGKSNLFQVHRLVGNAFIDNPNSLPMINHKDENPSNNCVDNLEWCTAAYNNTYGTRIAKAVTNTDYNAKVANTDYKAIGKKLSRQVYQYTRDGKLIKIWSSTAECGRNGFNRGNVAACCRKCFNREGNNIYKGYIWSYVPLDTI